MFNEFPQNFAVRGQQNKDLFFIWLDMQCIVGYNTV